MWNCTSTASASAARQSSSLRVASLTSIAAIGRHKWNPRIEHPEPSRQDVGGSSGDDEADAKGHGEDSNDPETFGDFGQHAAADELKSKAADGEDDSDLHRPQYPPYRRRKTLRARIVQWDWCGLQESTASGRLHIRK